MWCRISHGSHFARHLVRSEPISYDFRHNCCGIDKFHSWIFQFFFGSNPKKLRRRTAIWIDLMRKFGKFAVCLSGEFGWSFYLKVLMNCCLARFKFPEQIGRTFGDIRLMRDLIRSEVPSAIRSSGNRLSSVSTARSISQAWDYTFGLESQQAVLDCPLDLTVH